MDWTQSRAAVEKRLEAICVALLEVHEGPTFNGRSWKIRNCIQAPKKLATLVGLAPPKPLGKP